ncbi:MAG: nucleotidyltransferase substrate binding protein [Deltaproteobacteria bacterium]|nr:nucleotidyltransferase substrate binding protein [Deltaproteobacteria bacterium]
MEKKDIRWKQRLSNFKKALDRFEEAVKGDSKDRLAQEGLIQRFEYTFELAWKSLQDLLQERGLAEIRGPKPVLQQAFQDGLVQDGVIWMEMLRARNEATHLYDEKVFLEVYEKAQKLFLKPFQDLEKKLESL